MTDQNRDSEPKSAAKNADAKTAKQKRDERLRKALRDNLRRRKAQTKGRKQLTMNDMASQPDRSEQGEDKA